MYCPNSSIRSDSSRIDSFAEPLTGAGRAQQLEFVVARTDEAIAALEKKHAQIDETLAELRVINAGAREALARRTRRG